jgi:tetratricopeptide (TPR) repeat protein
VGQTIPRQIGKVIPAMATVSGKGSSPSPQSTTPTDSIVRKLFALIARSHQMLGDTREALRACARGLELDPDDAELWFRKAVVHRHRGESSQADQSWRRILSLHRPNEFCSLDQGIFGHLTLRNLAFCRTVHWYLDLSSLLFLSPFLASFPSSPRILRRFFDGRDDQQ